MTAVEVDLVRHNRIAIAMHHLRAAAEPDIRPLVLLHGLGECTPERVPDHIHWPGAVIGMDFTGHGLSSVPTGGGYTSEILVGDVDAVLEHLGTPVTLLGRGLGAYVALLVAAARCDLVRGAVLADGPGTAGGGVHPGSASLPRPIHSGGAPDPFALLELSRDVRPPDYARTIAGFAIQGQDLELAIWVTTVVRPAWIEAIVHEPGVKVGTASDALAYYAEH